MHARASNAASHQAVAYFHLHALQDTVARSYIDLEVVLGDPLDAASIIRSWVVHWLKRMSNSTGSQHELPSPDVALPAMASMCGPKLLYLQGQCCTPKP